MAEGGLIQKNTDPWTTDTIAHPVQQVPVLCIQCIDPGEDVPFPGLGVEAFNLEDLPLPRCQHHLAHLHFLILHQWLIACSPLIKGDPIVRSKIRDLPSILVMDPPSVENQI